MMRIGRMCIAALGLMTLIVVLGGPAMSMEANSITCRLDAAASGTPAYEQQPAGTVSGQDHAEAVLSCISTDEPPSYTASITVVFEQGDGVSWTDVPGSSTTCLRPSISGQVVARCSASQSFSASSEPLHRARITWSAGGSGRTWYSDPWYADGNRPVCAFGPWSGASNVGGQDVAAASAECAALDPARDYTLILTITAEHFDAGTSAWEPDGTVTCSRDANLGLAVQECPYLRGEGPPNAARRFKFVLEADGVTLTEYFP